MPVMLISSPATSAIGLCGKRRDWTHNCRRLARQAMLLTRITRALSVLLLALSICLSRHSHRACRLQALIHLPDWNRHMRRNSSPTMRQQQLTWLRLSRLIPNKGRYRRMTLPAIRSFRRVLACRFRAVNLSRSKWHPFNRSSRQTRKRRSAMHCCVGMI